MSESDVVVLDLWMPRERREEIKAKLFRYYGCNDYIGPKAGEGFIDRLKAREGFVLNPSFGLRVYLQHAGITMEEFARFCMSSLDFMSAKIMNVAGGEPLDRFKEGEVEYIVCRIIGLPKRLLPDSVKVPTLYLRLFMLYLMDLRIRSTGVSDNLDQLSSELGLSVEVLVDATVAFFRSTLDEIRVLATRGPLLPHPHWTMSELPEKYRPNRVVRSLYGDELVVL